MTKTGEGTLILDAPATAANVIVSKGELDLNGIVTGNVDVKSGTTFSPGNDVGAATVDGTFTAEAGSTLRFERNANGQVDSLTALEFNIDEATRIELALGTFGAAAEIDLITNSSETGFTPEQSTPDFWMRKLVEALPHYMDLSVFNNSIVRLTVDGNAIPEPSTWVILLLGAFGLFYSRKRK